MSKTKVFVRTQQSANLMSEQSVLISDLIIRHWKIPTDQNVMLRFGSARYYVRVMPMSPRNEMRISGALSHQLGLAGSGATLRLSYKSSTRSLHIGPIIGVMIPQIKGSLGRRFGIIHAFCRELSDACQLAGAFVYFFTPDDIRSTHEKIEGWTMIGQEYKSTFPVPDVIYNRLPSRRLDGQPALQQFLKEAKATYGTAVFNEKYLDKTEVFEALQTYPRATRYLPESHAYKGISLLKAMCAKHRTIFLKPITGSLGKGIIRVSRITNGYQVASSSMTGVNRKSYSDINALVSSLSGKLRSGKYQIQQGLELICVGNRPVDFRALVQRNISGQWVVNSIVARIAGTNRFVSNIAQGGTVGTVKQTIAKSNLSMNQNQVYTNLKLAAIRIAEGIENTIPFHFGELGVDLAIDRNGGKVWLLEVNSKPSKNNSSLINEDKNIRPSVKLLVQYFRYLARL